MIRKRKILFLVLILSLMIGMPLNVNQKALGLISEPIAIYKMKCYGTVIDKQTGSKLEGVTVVLKELSTGISKTVTTDPNGYYSVTIQTLSYTKHTLKISLAGYYTQTRTYTTPTTRKVDVYLIPDDLSIDIRNIGNYEIIRYGSTIDVIAKCTGSIDKIYVSFDEGSSIEMTECVISQYYSGSIVIDKPNGNYILLVYALDFQGNILIFDQRVLKIVSANRMVLYYEIDCMLDAYSNVVTPPRAVLDYWVNYWGTRAISVNYRISDTNIPYKKTITSTDLIAYELAKNNHTFADYGTIDDRRSTNGGKPVLYSQEKWILWGSNMSALGSTKAGDCTCNSNTEENVDEDCLGGNYVYISAEACIEEENSNPNIIQNGLLITALMHEVGHTIGIMKREWDSSRYPPCYVEDYDTDKYSVMVSNSTIAAKFTNHWYYSYEYWATLNDFY